MNYLSYLLFLRQFVAIKLSNCSFILHLYFWIYE